MRRFPFGATDENETVLRDRATVDWVCSAGPYDGVETLPQLHVCAPTLPGVVSSVQTRAIAARAIRVGAPPEFSTRAGSPERHRRAFVFGVHRV